MERIAAAFARSDKRLLAAARLRQRALVLIKRADRLAESATTEGEREIDAIEARREEWFRNEHGAHRIDVGGHTARVAFGACRCCLRRIYEYVRDPAYAPKGGDFIPCAPTCVAHGFTEGWVFTRNTWKNRRWHLKAEKRP